MPQFLPGHRWFADEAHRSVSARVSTTVRIEHADDRFAAVIIDVSGPQGTSRYFLPLTIRWKRYTD